MMHEKAHFTYTWMCPDCGTMSCVQYVVPIKSLKCAVCGLHIYRDDGTTGKWRVETRLTEDQRKAEGTPATKPTKEG